jgi:hypothetical protein
MSIEINGIKYQEIKREPYKPSKAVSRVMTMAMMIGGLDCFSGGSTPKTRHSIDLVKEYELIQQKKSNLTKRQRDQIEWRFNRQYERVEEDYTEVYMSKDEAIEAMINGAKVTHQHFSPDEWITMEGNLTIITEEGYSCDSDEFWRYREGAGFDEDWSIWEETTE